jgi:ribonuclease R
MLVEEFMLLANKTVAKQLTQPKKAGRKSFVYRVHDKPEQERIEEFAGFVKSLGYTFNISSSTSSTEIQRVISQVKNTEEEAVVNELAIRSMAKAVYSAKNVGPYIQQKMWGILVWASNTTLISHHLFADILIY